LVIREHTILNLGQH